MDFTVRSPLNKPDVVEVRYDCACGCKPRARWQRGTAEAGHEHCCCGLVHFVGPEAEGKLKAYLVERKARGEDAGREYALHTRTVNAPWGDPVSVAYGIPNTLSPHGG